MTCAMILCAGFGTRLGDLTKDTPKPMLKLGDKPILEHTIIHLKKHNVNQIVINLHYMADKITSYFENGQKWGVNIYYSYEESPLGTAGAVKKVESDLLNAENFLVLYGDIVTNQNYSDFIDFHKTKNTTASIILHQRNKSNSIVEMDDNNKIINFIERPSEEQLSVKKQNWVNSGLYCFNKNIFNLIPEGKSDFPKNVFPELIKNGNLYGFPLNGYRCAIDSPERFSMVQSDYEKGIIYCKTGGR